MQTLTSIFKLCIIGSADLLLFDIQYQYVSIYCSTLAIMFSKNPCLFLWGSTLEPFHRACHTKVYLCDHSTDVNYCKCCWEIL